jgi:hypothetical protein
MEQRPSWEANSLVTELYSWNVAAFMKVEGSLSYSQYPATGPYSFKPNIL